MKQNIKKIFWRMKTFLIHAYVDYRRFLGLPGMTDSEIEMFKKIFRSYLGKRMRILEWGCGRSTIFYAKYLRSLGISFEWYGIENSRKWYESIKGKTERNMLFDSIHLFLFEFVPFWMKSGWSWKNPALKDFGELEKNEKDYISFPESLGVKFDVIIVDARFRRRCLIASQKLLAPKGIVVLHDAQKEKYHSSLSLFKYGGFYDSGYLYDNEYSYNGAYHPRNQLWIGSNDDCIIEKINADGDKNEEVV
jgi:hypothetical protein